MSLTNVICPDDCNFSLPAVDFADCLRKGDFAKSRIVRLYISTLGYPFTDVSDVTEWTSRLNQTPTNPNDIRELRGIGSKPAPEKNEITLSDYRKVVLSKNHNLLFRVDTSNSTNQALINFFECNPTVLLWYGTEGNHLFGGNEGIKAQVTMDLVLTDDETGVETYEMSITWKRLKTEQWVNSPVPVSF